MQDLTEKLANCRHLISRLERVVVAFSAGVDSTFLLALAAETLGRQNVLAAIGVSPSLPQRELESARKLADQLGVELAEVATGEMNDPHFNSNPSKRCYYCKSDLFSKLKELAARRQFSAVACGANADDSGDYRPGLEAGKEAGVVNPLMEAGLTKADIRQASKEMNLPTWDKPAMACLASRIPYGQLITPQRLGRIEQAENFLKDLKFVQCRVRDHGDVARVEIPREDFARFLENAPTVTQNLKKLGFSFVTLDLEGFSSGSMNRLLKTQP